MKRYLLEIEITMKNRNTVNFGIIFRLIRGLCSAYQRMIEVCVHRKRLNIDSISHTRLCSLLLFQESTFTKCVAPRFFSSSRSHPLELRARKGRTRLALSISSLSSANAQLHSIVYGPMNFIHDHWRKYGKHAYTHCHQGESFDGGGKEMAATSM